MYSILILNWRDIKNKNAGGAEVFAYEMATRFVRDGHKVTWFTSSDPLLPNNENLEGINIIRRGSWLSVFIWGFFYYIFSLRKKADVIIDCQNGIPFFSPLYSSKKIICVVHHVHQEIFKHYSPNFFIKHFGIILEKMIPVVYRKHEFVSVSPSTILSMKNLLGIKKEIHLIYNGINHSLFSPGPKTKYPTILYLGRLKKYKKIDNLIIAFSILHKNIPEARCIIAGTGEEQGTLTELAKSIGLERSIEFKGFVTEEVKKKILKEAWVLVYPSIHEGWGISILEANACGTVSVGSDVSGLKDSIRHNETGILYPLGNKARLTDALFDILTDKTKRHDMEQNAVEWSKKFNWEDSYKKMRSLIKQ